MWFLEISVGDLLFSPLALFVAMSLILTGVTHLLIHRLSLGHWIWKEAWFDVSLFFCYLALIVFVLKAIE